MSTFVAHYKSSDSSLSHGKGLFEFESEGRLGSKANAQDARVHMLEIFGNEALSWSIDSIEHKPKAGPNIQSDGQMELDFRELAEKGESKRRRSTKRGVL